MPDNWALAPLNLADKDGGNVRYYRLFLDGGWGPADFIGWITSNILYQFVAVPTAYSDLILRLVTDPATWLKPIEQAWTSVTAQIFRFAPPMLVLVVALLAALLTIVLRSRRSGEDTFQQEMGQRLAASAVMYLVILALLYNPAGSLLKVLTVWTSALSALDSSPSGAEPLQPDAETARDPNLRESVTVTEFLRPLTWTLNYGSQLSSDCGHTWSQTLKTSAGNLPCLTAEQHEAARSVGVAFIMTLFAIALVVIFVRFAIAATIAFVTHVTAALVKLAGAGAMAGASVYQERPMDEFLRFLLGAVAHLIIASGVVGAAKIGPRLATLTSEAITDSALVHFAVLLGAYYLLSHGIWWLERRYGPLRDWLDNKTTSSQSRYWKLVFPGGLNPQHTALDRAVESIRTTGSRWAQQAREQITNMTTPQNPPAASSSPASASGALPDTPQTRAALSVVRLPQANTSPVGSGTDHRTSALTTTIQTYLQLPAAQTDSETSPAATHPSLPPQPHTPPQPRHAAPEQTPPPPSSTPAPLPWRQHLTSEISKLHETGTAAGAPSAAQAVRIETPSTLNHPDATPLAPPPPRAPLSAHLARLAYLELILRAAGWQGRIDHMSSLPRRARFFTSGQDENGTWTTQFT